MFTNSSGSLKAFINYSRHTPNHNRLISLIESGEVPLYSKRVLLIVTSHECLSFTVNNDIVCAVRRWKAVFTFTC